MPYTPLKIHIPEPCGENWEAMHPVLDSTARHCDSCAKNVVDFTGFTDAQVHKYMRESGGKLCGRFRPDQLGRPLRAVTAPKASPLRKVAAAAGLLLAATGCETDQKMGAPGPESAGYDPITRVDGPAAAILGSMEAPPPPPPPPIAGDPAFIEARTLPPRTGGAVTSKHHPEAEPEEEYEVFGDISFDVPWDTLPTPPDEAPAPPPPPPPPAEGMIVIEEVGEIEWIEEPGEQDVATATDSIIPDCQVTGDVLTSEDIRNLPTRDIGSIASTTMGVVAYTPPKAPTLADSLRDLFAPTPLSEDLPAHQRPRPVPQFLTDVAPYPNPFVEQLRLEVNAPEAGLLQVELVDAGGRRILRQKWDTQAGYNELTLRPRQRKLRGELFYVRLTTDGGLTVAKPVVRR